MYVYVCVCEEGESGITVRNAWEVVCVHVFGEVEQRYRGSADL